MSEFGSSPRIEPSRQLSALTRSARQWLDGPASVVHWWSPDADVLEQGVEALCSQALDLHPGRPLRVFHDGDFLPVLRQLNALVEALGQGGVAAQAQVGQVWVLPHAQRMAPEHLDILRRSCLNYPELGLRVALLSQSLLAPDAAHGIQIVDIQQKKEDLVQTQQPVAAPMGSTAQQQWLVWVLGGATVALSAMMLLQAIRMATTGKPVVKAATAASVPAVPEPVATASPAPAVTPAAVQVPAVEASAPEKALVEVSSPAPVVEKASASRRWLSGLPPDSLVVAHVRVNTLREAEGFRSRKEVLANARILVTAPEGGQSERYLVVTGPFRSPERARNHIQRLEWKDGAASFTREELLRLTR